jgi:hypothetical protein
VLLPWGFRLPGGVGVLIDFSTPVFKTLSTTDAKEVDLRNVGEVAFCRWTLKLLHFSGNSFFHFLPRIIAVH